MKRLTSVTFDTESSLYPYILSGLELSGVENDKRMHYLPRWFW